MTVIHNARQKRILVISTRHFPDERGMSSYLHRPLQSILSLLSAMIALALHPSLASAELLQIIHTNDLHSYMEQSDVDGWGGYAAVKATIERAKLDAKNEGIETVVLDAGDFSEGSPLFFSDRGRQSWRVIDAMGYDAVTIGNHDWLIGAHQLNQIFAGFKRDERENQVFHTPFLAANINIDAKKYPDLKNGLKPYTEITRGGLKIAVLGVTTDEMFYTWRMKGGGIASPLNTAQKYAPSLKSKNDLVIALTHIGVMQDINLAGKTSGIDVVIGGHSHTKLDTPLNSKNTDGISVPIAQTGKHGDRIGVMTLDVRKGEPVKIVKYELIEVRNKDAFAPEAAPIHALVQQARRQLETRYSPDWLYDMVGMSDIALERPETGYTQWGNFMLESMRQAAGADIALDAGEFTGPTLPAGVITNETIMKSYPRVFDINNASGWTLWKIKVPGWVLKLVLAYVVNNGMHLNVSGLGFDTSTSKNGVEITQLRVKGQKVSLFKNYTVAVSEGIGRGALEIHFLLRLAFSPKNTGLPVWTVLAQKLRETGGNFGDRSYLTPNLSPNLPPH